MYDNYMAELSGGSMISKGSVSSEAGPWHGLHGGTKPPCSALTSASTSGASKRRTRRGPKTEQLVPIILGAT